VNAEGIKKSLQWRLIAGKGKDDSKNNTGDGINVPIIALFLMIEKLGNNKVKIGARPCLSLLKLQEFKEVFKQFNIECFTDDLGSHTALFPRELGPNYQKLPQIIKDIHDVQDEVKAAGKAEIHRGKNIFADMAGWCFHLPPSGSDVPVKVCFKKEGEGEILSRNFNGKVFSSAFTPAAGDGMMTERFGPFKFLLYLDCHEKGIDFNLKKIWVFGWLPIPLFFGPKITAYERAAGPIYHFDVEITLPIIGRIIHYRGTLKMMAEREDILQIPE
jgi:hypothetical protein